MGDKTHIQWTDATWNPLRGCSKVSEGCRNCYAMGVAARFNGPGQPYEGLAVRTANAPQWTNKIMLVEDKLTEPLHWTRPRLIFVNSMSDLFHPDVPDDFIDRVFAVMASCPHHTFQVLTKRPDRMQKYLSYVDRADKVISEAVPINRDTGGPFVNYAGKAKRVKMFSAGVGTDGGPSRSVFQCSNESPLKPWWPLHNVWLGVSAEDQATWDTRIPPLLQTPASVRWVSAEPLLGPIDGGGYSPQSLYEPAERTIRNNISRIDWLVCGGESGPGAREMHEEWALSLRDQCRAAGTAFFFKQWGGFAPTNEYRDGRRFMSRGDKRENGRMLAGRTHDDYPTPKETR